jgi:DNA mismatch endonuclease (patch repair protein)
MRAVKSQDTKPEMQVRRLVHAMGYRYRLHAKNLAGKPDLVFASRKKVIFVHGCFWHGHDCKRGKRIPKTNTDYWLGKVGRNRTRDDAVLAALKAAGWRALTIWECEMADQDALRLRLSTFLSV